MQDRDWVRANDPMPWLVVAMGHGRADDYSLNSFAYFIQFSFAWRICNCYAIVIDLVLLFDALGSCGVGR